MLIRQRGFTLIELMITVAIIAIIASVAYPSYQDSLRKSRRTDGKNALTQAVANMERYYTERGSTYATAELCPDTTVTTPNLPVICPGSCAAASGGACTSTEGKYIITFPATPTATTFSILATPQGSQAVDGKLYIDSTNVKKQDINNNGTFEASENYWK